MEGHDRQRYKAWHRMMMMMYHADPYLSVDLFPPHPFVYFDVDECQNQILYRIMSTKYSIN